MKQQQHTWQKSFLLVRSSLLLLFALLVTSGLFAQRQISGTIVDDETSEPLIGASVLVQGTSTGTITDIDGNYTIQANSGDVLIVSYTGYTTDEITVGTENVYNINMGSGVMLDELVVTGYTSQSRRSITGAVSSVDIDEIKSLPTATVDQALQGKVAGVSIGQSGAPGEGVMVRIRGFGTINNNNPLYIIDGLPIQSAGLNELNPNDIESIQVLKDASSASIYGARAANGVIIITTKKGSVTGKPKVSLNVYYGSNYVPTSALEDFATPQELADVLFESQKNAHDPTTGEFVFNHPQYGGSGSGATLPDFITPAGASTGDPNTSADTYSYDRDGGAFNPITASNKTGTNWLDEILDPGTIQSYQLSVTGGNESASYALSGGYYDQEGVVINTGFKRYSIRANSQFRVKERIRVGENLSVVSTNKTNMDGSNNGTGNALSMAYRMPGIIPVFDIGGNYAGANGTGLTNADNPVALLTRHGDDQDRRIRVFGNVYAEVDLIDGLTFKSSVGADYNTTHNSTFSIRNVEASEPDASNSLTEYTDFNVNWNWYNTLTYSTTFAEDHELTLLAGTEAIENEFRTFEAARSGFFSDDFGYRYLNTGAAGISNAGRGSEWSLFSVFGKADYAFQGKYLLSATIRRDGSSRFGEDNRYGVFPAFSVGWRLSDEAFLRDVSFINDLKLRVGWGQTGNQEIGDYAFATTYSSDLNGAGYPIGGGSVVVGLDSRVFGNPDVKWETTTSLNVGLDASLLNNRISVAFDWYDNDTEGMLLNPRVAATNGFAAYAFQNLGDMNNTGFDLGINFNSPAGSELTYSFGLNFSKYKNEVVNLDGLETTFINGGEFRDFFASRTQVGEPIASYYGLIVDGIFQDQNEVDNGPTDADGNKFGVGRFRYRDLDANGVIDADDYTFLGSPHPDFSYGLNVSLGYKGIDFTVFIMGVSGNELFNANKLFTDFPTFQQNRSKRVVDQTFGFNGADNASAILPLLSDNSPSLERSNTSYYVEDGSFLKVKNLQLGYTLPKDIVSNIGLDRLRFYIQGINLLVFTDYQGIDPEVSLDDFSGDRVDLDIGVDRGFYPVPRSVVFGINADF